MVIGFNTSPLFGGHAGRGTGTYTKSLLQALENLDNAVIVRQFRNTVIEAGNVELLHYPFFDPFLYTLPMIKTLPVIVTVHDLIPIMYQRYFPRGMRGEILWNIQKLSLKGVREIITDSEASKKDICSITGFKEELVNVIPLAPNTIFFKRSIEEQKIIREKYKLPKEFVLYVGDVNWNKNIPSLIRAVLTVGIPLVLVGKPFLDKNLKEAQEIQDVIEKNDTDQNIYRTGYVSNEDLSAIYSAARCYIQVSIAEGFGLPVLESMACGTPAVVSSTSSLVEIAGPSVQVDPLEEKDIVRGVKEQLGKEKKIESQKAIHWAAKFTWEKTAEKTIAIYKKVLRSI